MKRLWNELVPVNNGFQASTTFREEYGIDHIIISIHDDIVSFLTSQKTTWNGLNMHVLTVHSTRQ